MSPARAQSNVVGVALLLGVTVMALAALTASVGTVIEGSAASADAQRVATDLDAALEPVEATGDNRGRVSFTEGELEVVDRELRVLDASGVVRTLSVDALEFAAGSQRVVYLAGAVIRETGSGAEMSAAPPLTASRGSGGVLVVGAPVLNASTTAIAATGSTTAVLSTDVSHERTELGNGTYRVAVETRTPGAWTRFFEDRGATVTGRRDFDGDGVRSVVAKFTGERVGYLVEHDLRLEVRLRG